MTTNTITQDEETQTVFTREHLSRWDDLPKEQLRRYHGNRTPEPRVKIQVRHELRDTRLTPVVPRSVYDAIHDLADRRNWSINLALLKLLLRGLIAVQEGEEL